MKVADIKRLRGRRGVIGSSWAIQFAMRGLAVTLHDINDEQLKRSEAQMHKSLDALEQFNAITPERRGEIVAAIRLTTSMEEAVADAQFIQESGPERLEIKQSILAQVEACAAADALYASSTSGLLISDIAARRRPTETLRGGPPLQSAPPHSPGGADLRRQDRPRPAPAGLRLLPVHRQGGRPPAPGVPRLHRQPAPAGPLPGGAGSGDAGGVLRGGRGQGPGLRPRPALGHLRLQHDHAAGQPRRPDRHGEYAGQLRRPLAGQHGLWTLARQQRPSGPARRGRGDEALPRPHRPHQRGVRGLPRQINVRLLKNPERKHEEETG